MFITDDIRYIGVNDHQVDLFEGQYAVPNGMAYNSYVILDEKVAVMDTVDVHFCSRWLQNLAETLEDRKPDYLVVQHMEPDHSAGICAFLEAYPEAVVVGNAKTFTLMEQFFGAESIPRRCVVENMQVLSLGKHSLTFVFAPMVHWPEVMLTYESTDRVLFSADAFGKFGALDVEEEWDCEARRYYFGIVGKYGAMVQTLLKKAAALDIQIICPLHGPVLSGGLSHYIGLYDTWSSYRPEDRGVVIAFASIYGHTREAAELLAEKLREKGEHVVLTDLAREDMAEAVEDAFRYDRLILASVTYNGDIFPFMKTFVDHLTERAYQNRKIGFMENGSWAPQAKRIMQGMFEKSRNITFYQNSVTIRSALQEDSLAAIDALADEICG